MEEEVVVEHRRDLPAEVHRVPVHQQAVDPDIAGKRRLAPGNGLRHGGLAGTVDAHHAQDLTGPDGQGDLAAHRHAAVPHQQLPGFKYRLRFRHPHNLSGRFNRGRHPEDDAGGMRAGGQPLLEPLATNRVSACSSDMPLVSGTLNITKKKDAAANRAYMA